MAIIFTSSWHVLLYSTKDTLKIAGSVLQSDFSVTDVCIVSCLVERGKDKSVSKSTSLNWGEPERAPH